MWVNAFTASGRVTALRVMWDQYFYGVRSRWSNSAAIVADKCYFVRWARVTNAIGGSRLPVLGGSACKWMGYSLKVIYFVNFPQCKLEFHTKYIPSFNSRQLLS
jgi:hypothetical protein